MREEKDKIGSYYCHHFIGNNCYYLDEIVYNYVVRANSHSRMNRDFNKQIDRSNGIRETLKKTIKNLKLDKAYMKDLFCRIDQEYDKALYYIYCAQGDKEKTREFYKKISSKNMKIRIAYLVGNINIINKLYVIYKKNKITLR